MATTSSTAQRWLAGFASTLLFALCLSVQALGQGTPLVTVSSSTGLSHPTGWGTIVGTAINQNGDWVVVDNSNAAVYEFPAGGGAAITLAAPNSLATGYGNGGNPGVVIDPNNNIYFEANYNNALVMFPWDPVTSTWTGLSGMTAANPSTAICTNSGKNNEANCWAQYGIGGYSQGYFQPLGIAIGTNGTLLVGAENSGNFIMSFGVNNAWTNPTVGSVTVEQITTMTKPAISVAQDPEGNIYFVENSGGLPGLYRIPAGSSGLAGDNDPSITRVDPNLPSVTGVTMDAAGNLYVSDSKAGVFLIPNPSGTPQTSSTVMITPVPAEGEVAIDWARNLMYVPTTQKQNNGQADAAMLRFGYAELGSSPVGTAAALPGTVNFGFNGTVTPASFVIVEDGVSTPDFVISGGTCTTGTAYNANSGCQENITFNPTAVGSASAKLLMLDKSNNVLASMMLHGTGMGSNIQVSPAIESTIGSGLKTPDQIAVDEAGNVYVADAGLGKVLMYAAGSGTGVSIGTGLTSPTGVAVDGAGDVFIADSGTGSVYEVPFGSSGLNAAGQVTLVSSLGTALNLAMDGGDNLYIADPTNMRVVKLSNVSAAAPSNFGQAEILLTNGFTAPSAVAVDANNNLYVIDGTNLLELMGGAGAPTILLNNLSGATGLAVDPSGAVYVSSASGTTRISSIGGTLIPADETAVASNLSNTSSVALDRLGNVYLTQASGGGVTLVTTNGTLTLQTPATLASSTNAIVTLTNAGNAPLTVTGYTSSNSVDFTAADTATGGCEAGSPLAAGATCTVNVTFDPGPGEQGALVSTIGVTGSQINIPVTIGVSGVGLTLGGSAANITVATAAEVVDTPLTVTVAPQSGSGVPTGEVTVTFTTWTVQTNTSCANPPCPQTIVPVTSTVTATLDATGKATFNLAPVMAGAQNFKVSYGGDRTYGTSTQTVTATVAKSQIAAIALPKLPDPTDVNLPFVVPNNGSGSVPYDSSETPWQYSLTLKVNTAFGIPTGSITMMDNSSTCPPGTSAAGVGAATCALANYSGVACPQNSAAGNLVIQNGGTPNSSGTSFTTSCLYQVPSGTTYTPVVYTHYVTPVYSGDANFQSFTGPSTLFQATRGPLVQITTPAASSATAAPTLSITAGSSASITLNLTSILGYGISGKNALLNNSTFPITLNCDNLPPHATCSFYYPNPDANIATATDIPWPANCTTQEVAEGLADSSGDLCVPSLTPVSTSSGTMTTGTGQVVMTINTNVTVGTTTSKNATDTSATLAALFGFGMIGLFVRRRTFEKGRRLLMILLMVIAPALAISITACNTTNLSPEAVLSSPSGSYAVTVTAQQVGDQCEPSGPLGSNCTTTSGGTGQLAHGSNNPVSLPFHINVTVQ
jgi:sugar lactone lactonase YvrE